MAGLQTMAACWRSSLWSCCLTDAPTWTQWVAADSGCWREGRGTAITQLTLSTWRTSRSGCHRSQTVADLEKSATIAESSLSLSSSFLSHVRLPRLSGGRWRVGGPAGSPWQCVPAGSGLVPAPRQPHSWANQQAVRHHAREGGRHPGLEELFKQCISLATTTLTSSCL